MLSIVLTLDDLERPTRRGIIGMSPTLVLSAIARSDECHVLLLRLCEHGKKFRTDIVMLRAGSVGSLPSSTRKPCYRRENRAMPL